MEIRDIKLKKGMNKNEVNKLINEWLELIDEEYLTNQNEDIAKIKQRIDEKLSELTNALEKCEFRAAVFALRSLWAIGNEYMTEKEPWALVKNGDMDTAEHVLNNCFQLIDRRLLLLIYLNI